MEDIDEKVYENVIKYIKYRYDIKIALNKKEFTDSMDSKEYYDINIKNDAINYYNYQ